MDRRGKKILLRLASGHVLCIHLGMSGRLTVEPHDAPLLPHTHLVVDFEGDDAGVEAGQLRFCDPRRFGGIWWLGPTDAVDENLGPEALSLRAEQLAARLARTRRAIKTVLLDQTVLAGLGNIYADEALFAAGVCPLTPARDLSREQVAALNRAIKLTLRRAIRHRGSTLRDYVDADGRSGGFQLLHRVYDREGQACSRCGTAIVRVVLGGRSTHYCPKCQAQLARAYPDL